MPDYPNIDRYYSDLAELIELGGSDNELNIRPAFQNCLAAYCAAHREKLVLVPELASSRGNTPDGTIRDVLRMARGYWEAKDPHDNLDAEIQAKFSQGYPTDNILFEDSREAVLFQNGAEAMRVEMTDASKLHRLIDSFLNYELPEIGEFRQAQQQFKSDLPSVLESLRLAVAEAEANNTGYQDGAAKFLELCRHSISPDVSEADVREMLLQHILTKDIFLRVFVEDQFHRENNVARQLDDLERTFFTGDVRRQARDRLQAYYGAIGRAADEIAEYTEKQQFLKAIYEDFYKAYNPAAADRLGVVYTPNEVVDFIIRGTDHLLQKHFGRSLADDNVQILDPATGTGTFVTSLIDYLPADRLEHKYLNEIYANEVAILPYYIANLNIEYTYKERTGEYREFPNLCFVDTLDNMEWRGIIGGTFTYQIGLNLGGVSEDNLIRMKSQNEQIISVIIGNPPYNANQQNWNDFNPNLVYPDIDQRIHDTYVRSSSATKTKQYDMYKRFVRWASDRLADDGIIAFITNRAYLDSLQDDGFRKEVAREFSSLYIIDLGGNFQKEGRGGNVFGIRIGVAVCFLVKSASGKSSDNVHYYSVGDKQTAREKLSELTVLDLGAIPFVKIEPDTEANWFNQASGGFEGFLPLVLRSSNSEQNYSDGNALFSLHSLGVSTNRDEWVFDFDVRNLRERVLFFCDVYDDLMDRDDRSYPTSIKWSSTLRDRFNRGQRIVYNDGQRIESLYRPYTVKQYFANPSMSDRLTQNHHEMFGPSLQKPNAVICINGPGSNNFVALGANKLVEKKYCDTNNAATFCVPLYRYTRFGEQVSNITEWGLQQFRKHYEDDSINAEDIFAYTYAALHDPAYRQKYLLDLRREFPRLPFHGDFRTWVKLGQELLDLHIGFENAEPYGLKRLNKDIPSTGSESAVKVRLKANKTTGRIVLDDKTTLTGVPEEAWEYLLGSRSALEWVLDQYKEKKPRNSTVPKEFKTYSFADHKERVIDLLQRVCTVSVETVRIVGELERMSDIAAE